jgi:hypothetical protein
MPIRYLGNPPTVRLDPVRPNLFDLPLQDDELLSEVELTTELMIAASESAHRLAQGEIDAILGVVPCLETCNCGRLSTRAS